MCMSSVRARAERVREGAAPAYISEIKFIHSGPAARGGVRRGPARERGGRGGLCRAPETHAPRSRARPPAPQPQARCGPALPAPRRCGSRFPPAPPGPGEGDWEEPDMSRGRRIFRKEEGAGGGGGLRSSGSERGHAPAPPREGGGKPRRGAPLVRSCPGCGPLGRPRMGPVPTRAGVPQLFKSKFVQPSPPSPPPPFSRRNRRTAPAPGARVGAPVCPPGAAWV